MKFWDIYSSWEEAEEAWDREAKTVCVEEPLVPVIVDRRFLKLKALFWAFRRDRRFSIVRKLLRRPVRYLYNYLSSLFFHPAYHREEDFFCFGIKNVHEWMGRSRDENTILLLGFSYCQAPKECPMGRFSDRCMADPDHGVCRSCFIGKCLNTLPSERTEVIRITTLNAIGNRMLELLSEGRQVLFLITSCEMSIEMGGDFANMVGCKGIGVKLRGRCCNTWKGFQLAEDGIKPGVTALAPSTQRRVLSLLRYWREGKATYHSDQPEDGRKAPISDSHERGVG